MQRRKSALLVLPIIILSCSRDEKTNRPSETTDPSAVVYKMPEESAPHEGTRLQWPHEYQYGTTYRDRPDPTDNNNQRTGTKRKGSYCGL